jgi:hypothetical protein
MPVSLALWSFDIELNYAFFMCSTLVPELPNKPNQLGLM